MTGQRHLCEGCHARKALFQYRGTVRADATHTLCFACFRSERDRLRARALASLPVRATGSRDLSAAQRAHRFRMLAHLRRTAR
jgi:hypothetical protein